ncbi:MAG TPA: peptidase C1A papain [Chitinophagaceae bacterium]|nr:peptidase C1A papain [Chitinophagaceae bacterium]
MPIRMEDDQQDQQDFDESKTSGGGGGGTGGGGGLMNLLPMLLMLFRGGGGGKKILLLLVAGAAAYFFFFRNAGGGGGGVTDVVKNLFSQSGYNYNADTFKKASVYEGLADDNTKNPLPESVSLLRFAPERRNQGQQGSCVAWSSVYAARTIVEAASTGQNANNTSYSPAFVYNQIGLEGCQGAYIQNAMEFMTNKGVVAFNDFPYTDQDCSRQPNNALMNEASQNRMHGFTRLTDGESTQGISIRAIKEHLAKDAPVVIGMMVGGSFMQGMMGKELWTPTDQDRSQMGFGGHAMCVIGYDDRKVAKYASGETYTGAFQIMNSWGTEWGNNGVAWVGYADFKEFVREAYGIDPMPKRGAAVSVALECAIGLVKNDDKQYIPLRLKSGNIFETVNTVAPGTKFKMEVKNSVECYTYIFGQETDGSSYTLFPYPSKEDATKTSFSPYCGITGYRLFPRGKSLVPDNVGNKDVFAIVVTKQPLDWYALNNAISKSSGSSYGDKVSTALNQSGVGNVRYAAGSGGTINFREEGGQQKAVICVVEVNK